MLSGRKALTVLYLGTPSRVLEHLRKAENEVIVRQDPLTDEDPALEADFLVSFGYRHILPESVLCRFPDRAVNLHISLLPWNRGADPNLWSFLDQTPQGVTVHFMDAGVDTGDIIVQREVRLRSGTLRTTYEELRTAISDLFIEHWEDIRSGRAPRRPQRGPGTYHRVRDKEPIMERLADGWDTPVEQVIELGEQLRREGILPRRSPPTHE